MMIGLSSQRQKASPCTAPLWVADVFFEPHFAEEHNLLQGIPKPKDHIYNFDEVGEHWVKTKLDKRFFYGQDNAGSGTTFSWIVYHPPSWEPKQANFGQNGFTTIAADLVTSSVKSLTSAGLKIADPSGLLNAGVINLVGWEKVGNDAKSFANSYGDPLRRFGEHSLTEAQEKQLKFDQGEYNLSFGIVWDQMKQDSRFSRLPEIQQNVLSTAMVALNLGVQGTAEEGAHHSLLIPCLLQNDYRVDPHRFI
ncbi:uncharacterized protein BDV14DRAFT_206114 [Aspergillus stella-maris]|uniref:uncharacterized protein n=1 Tax=Aspergillus stella-maris TaxID=1810926 RepID=UPI003CCCC25D